MIPWPKIAEDAKGDPEYGTESISYEFATSPAYEKERECLNYAFKSIEPGLLTAQKERLVERLSKRRDFWSAHTEIIVGAYLRGLHPGNWIYERPMPDHAGGKKPDWTYTDDDGKVVIVEVKAKKEGIIGYVDYLRRYVSDELRKYESRCAIKLRFDKDYENAVIETHKCKPETFWNSAQLFIPCGFRAATRSDVQRWLRCGIREVGDCQRFGAVTVHVTGIHSRRKFTKVELTVLRPESTNCELAEWMYRDIVNKVSSYKQCLLPFVVAYRFLNRRRNWRFFCAELDTTRIASDFPELSGLLIVESMVDGKYPMHYWPNPNARYPVAPGFFGQ